MPNNSTPEAPPLPVFTIFLPSYEDAVKCPSDPPPYEQALTDIRLEDLEGSPLPSNHLPPHDQLSCPNRPQCHSQTIRQKFYKYFCWFVAVTVILLLSYIVYLSIARTSNDSGRTS